MTVAPIRLAEIARGVAPLLDGNWRYDARGSIPDKPVWGVERTIFNLDCPQMRFAITTPGEYSERHKACARGDFSVFDRALINSRRRHSIKFSPTRSIPALAADINRRFLNQFQDEWRRAKEEEQRRKDDFEALRHQIAMLQRVVPNMRRFGHYSNDRHHYYADLFDLEFIVSDNTVRIERLDLSLEQFVRLIFLLRGSKQSRDR